MIREEEIIFAECSGLNIKHYYQGFTIVEMIISVALFSIVMVFSVGAFLSIVSLNKQTQSMKSIVNNLNYSLETMVRNIRAGSNYYFDLNQGGLQNCPNGATAVSFIDQRGNRATYSLTNAKIMRNLKDSNGNQLSNFELTASEVQIDRLKFFIDGVELGDPEQPNVLILIGGRIILQSGRETRFDLETLAVQRLFNR